MDIEKFVNGKFYRGFEWFYRLIFLNVLLFLTSFLFASIPFYFFYKNQSQGILILVAIVLMAISFFPAFISSMLVIKDYSEGKTGNVFVLYFKYLLDTIKRTYIIEIILFSISIVVAIGVYFYWNFLGSELENSALGVIASIGLTISILIILFLVIVYINLTFLVTYFKMKTKGYLRIGINFSFKYMGQTILGIIILFIPLLTLTWLGMNFLPIYLILGISLPQFIIFQMNKHKYNYLLSSMLNEQKENSEK